LFFLITPSEYEAALKEEIWGCFKHMNIPLETIYSMPVMDRKYFIRKHNEAVKKENEAYENAGNSGKESNIEGVGINSYAKLEQQKKRETN
jgi:hypothetical protein